jgi:hypothetical protein
MGWYVGAGEGSLSGPADRRRRGQRHQELPDDLKNIQL